ncbi:uncharacterized protein MYCFIDRAFT_180065 [Pseudocercospora fijiensis CIRAD86]|uniref:Uncharacterized protein n=1 Tax=Pseudocercospora fijiensis (strain CIRAD86) TaxID=383855 RepID=M3AJ26_PSEFD|nr:uncharacterized protein MYCFIDRAFT_180065 [Pseudocercospora fijiensis CIRAD86]EME77188.1 hypothetical protein MYCFIDRAFT_180065 [Pseudocercospora fijiensis CIRAD86]
MCELLNWTVATSCSISSDLAARPSITSSAQVLRGSPTIDMSRPRVRHRLCKFKDEFNDLEIASTKLITCNSAFYLNQNERNNFPSNNSSQSRPSRFRKRNTYGIWGRSKSNCRNQRTATAGYEAVISNRATEQEIPTNLLAQPRRPQLRTRNGSSDPLLRGPPRFTNPKAQALRASGTIPHRHCNPTFYIFAHGTQECHPRDTRRNASIRFHLDTASWTTKAPRVFLASKRLEKTLEDWNQDEMEIVNEEEGLAPEGQEPVLVNAEGYGEEPVPVNAANEEEEPVETQKELQEACDEGRKEAAKAKDKTAARGDRAELHCRGKHCRPFESTWAGCYNARFFQKHFPMEQLSE